jgi:Uma2 family endonuclease
MALPQRYVEKDRYTEEEYLRWEEDALVKSEYVDGHIRAMSGGTGDHAAVIFNVSVALGVALRGRDCRGMSSDMKVWASGAFYYPDVTVVCGPTRYRGRGTLVVTNPRMVVEVLSPSTEAKDRGEKFLRYQLIETLEAYLLVSQSMPRVELFSRGQDGHWDYTVVVGLESVLEIPSLSIRLSLADIYDQIEFIDQAEDVV